MRILAHHFREASLPVAQGRDIREHHAAIGVERHRCVGQLIEARERVRRASTVRVARPAPAPRAENPAAERLRDAGKRLDDVISGQRHAADVIGDINRRFDEAG